MSLLPEGSRYQEAPHDQLLLGAGAFSTVIRARHKESGREVAIKLIERGNRVVASSRCLYITREICYQAGLSHHPCIVKVIEAFLTPRHLALVMELVPGGTLHDFLLGPGAAGRPPLTPAEARWLFHQFVVGLDFIHRRGVANRDIKLENILLDTDSAPRPLLKIADFSYTKHDADSAAVTVVGTAAYLAPEVLQWQQVYDAKKVDIWGAGIVLYCLLYRQLPFRPSRPDLFEGREEQRRPPPAGAAVDPGAEQLLDLLLARDPAQRPSTAQIMQHPWFKQGLPEGALRLNGDLLLSVQDDPTLPERVGALVAAAGQLGDPSQAADSYVVTLQPEEP